MRPAGTVGDGRVVVALSLSTGRCTVAENNGQRSTVYVVSGDQASGKVGGLAMAIPSAWDNSEGNVVEGDNNVLVVRTPFLTAEGGEAGTLPYAAYTQSLAAHVVTTLTHSGGADLITVTHGAAGCAKSIQLFGGVVCGGNGKGDTERCVIGHDTGLFSVVLERLFSAVEVKPCVAVSVVEWQPRVDDCKEYSCRNRMTVNTSAVNNGGEDTFLDDNIMASVEAIDLLAYANDRGSPTGCFMEDYADIPATRYVRCNNVLETFAVLRFALRHSLSWQLESMSSAQGPAEELGLRDSCLDVERGRRVAEVRAEEQPFHKVVGVHSARSWDGFLRPRTGASSHVLVTLLVRFDDGPTSVWRLWDLSGPSAWLGDGGPAYRMTIGTHTALSQMAHRYMHRDQLQGGWWLDALPPEHIEEIIPLCLKQGQSGGAIDKVAAMIEASLQHTCSSVLWIASLRSDACYDDINGDVLEAAASLLSGGDGTNGNLIAELRRRRRQENLEAAARVIDMFAEPFSHLGFESQSAEDPGGAMLTSVSTTLNAFDALGTSSSSFQMSPPISLEGGVPDSELLTLSDINRNSPVCSVQDTAIEISLASRNVSEVSLTLTPSMAAVVGTSPWANFVDRQSCLGAQPLHDDQKLQGLQVHQSDDDDKEGKNYEGVEMRASSHAPLHVSPLRGTLGVSERDVSLISPLSPPSVTVTEHPEGMATAATNVGRKDPSCGACTDGTRVPSLVSLQKGANYDDVCGAEVKFNEGALNASGNDFADLASTVQRLLERPLAQLQEIFLHHQEEFMLHRRRVIAGLNSLLSSDAVTVEELKKHVKSLLAEEKEVAVVWNPLGNRDVISSHFRGNTETATVELFGPCVSLQTSLEHQVAKCNICHVTNNNKRANCNGSSGGGSGRCGSSRRQCGCPRWGLQKDSAADPVRELIAAERKICSLERKLLQLEQENNRLKKELFSCGPQSDAATNIHELGEVFKDILERCCKLYAKKSTELDRMRQMYNATVNSLQRIQEQQVKNEAAVAQEEIWAASTGGLHKVETGPQFNDTTNRYHVKTGDPGRLCTNNTSLSFDLCPSQPEARIGDVDAIQHLRHVLMRATTFAATPVKPPFSSFLPQRQQKQHGQAEYNGIALSIDCGSDFSFVLEGRKGEQ